MRLRDEIIAAIDSSIEWKGDGYVGHGKAADAIVDLFKKAIPEEKKFEGV